MFEEFVALDLETTGLDPERDAIVELAAVHFRQGEVVAKYSRLVNPGFPLPLRIQKLTGLTDEELQGAFEFADLWPELQEFIADLPLVGHNLSFDLAFLAKAAGWQPLGPVFDTRRLCRIFYPTLTGYSLSQLARHFSLPLENEHRAEPDALRSGMLFLKIKERAARMKAGVLQLMVSSLAATDPVRLFLEAILAEKKHEFGAYSQLFAFERQDSAGEFLGEGELVDEDGGPNRGYLNEEEVVAMFTAGGKLGRELPGFEEREGQKEMAREVCRAFNEDGILLIEAGTGSGKSLAYLVPSLLWAMNSGEKVVLSTHTISLQEQIRAKDLPLLQKIWPHLRSAVIKGRANYLCLDRWFQTWDARQEGTAFSDFYLRLLVWLTETLTGDRNELSLNQQEEEEWYQLCCESSSCRGQNCFYRSSCFWLQALRRAREAHLIIVNHSLLVADLKTESAVLPAYERLVVDEAHHLEEEAMSGLGLEVGDKHFRRVFRLLLREEGRNGPGPRGILRLKLRNFAYNSLVPEVEATLVKIEEEAGMLKAAWEQFVKIIGFFLTPAGEEVGACCRRLDEYLACLLPEQRQPLENAAANLTSRLGCLRGELNRLLGQLALLDPQDDYLADSKAEWKAVATLVGQIEEDWQKIWTRAEADQVYWLEWDGTQLILRSAPLKVGEILRAKLFEQVRTVILTSATLTVNGSCSYFRERLGLDGIAGERVRERAVAPPFAYDSQALMCVVRDLPLPGEEDFSRAVADFLVRLLEVTGGSTMVLFTSHQMLREVYWMVQRELEEMDVLLLGQGIDGSRSRLLEEFKQVRRAVLFGASTFWEGVDLPGELLRCLVLVKIPFASPEIPVVSARLEEMAQQEKSGFWQFTLPQAVIKFKQGFGRLIRTREDKGVVVVLDRRLLEKKYGRAIFSSLPLRSHFRGSRDEVLKKIAEWLEGKTFPFLQKVIK